MKIAIVTANFGSFDQKHLQLEQSIECDYYYFDEKTTPYPLAGLNDRMKAKYFKLQTHRAPLNRKQYDLIVWHDASIKIASPDFLSFMLDKLDDNSIALPMHPKRPNLEEELLFIMDGIKDKDPYLCARYSIPAIREEYELIKGLKAEDLPLFACGLMAWRPSEELCGLFDGWWGSVLRYSEFDQCFFSYWFKDVKKGKFPFKEPFDKKLIYKTEHERH